MFTTASSRKSFTIAYAFVGTLLKPIAALALVVLPMISHARPVARDAATTPEVAMGEYMISSLSQNGGLQTYGVSTCVVLTLWDRSTGTGVLAHVSGMIGIPASMSRIFRDLRSLGVSTSRLEARILGGWVGWSEEMGDGLRSELLNRKVTIIEVEPMANVPFSRDGLIVRGGSSVNANRNYQLDLSTGDVSFYEETIPYLRRGPAIQVTMDMPLARHGESLRAKR